MSAVEPPFDSDDAIIDAAVESMARAFGTWDRGPANEPPFNSAWTRCHSCGDLTLDAGICDRCLRLATGADRTTAEDDDDE